MQPKIVSFADEATPDKGGAGPAATGVSPATASAARAAMNPGELAHRARSLYHHIAQQRLVGLVPDIGFERTGQPHKEFALPGDGTKKLSIYPESYNAFMLFSLLTKFVRGSLMYMGDPGLGKTTMAMIMGLATGRPYNDLKREVVHGQPQLSVADIFGSMHIPAYQQGRMEVLWHPRITNQQADLILNEINRMPTKTQSAILSALAEGYVEQFGQTFDVSGRAVFATLNDRNGGGTYELIHALRDRFNVAVMAFPRNSLYSGLILPDNTQPLPANMTFHHEELNLLQAHIQTLPLSEDAQRRLQFFMSVLNAAENASHSPEHGFKGTLSGSNVRSSLVFNGQSHDDPKKYLGALIEGSVGDRFLRSVIQYAQALAWFRGKPQVDAEDIAQVVPAVALHRLLPSPHFEKIDVIYKYDAWARGRYLWQEAMVKFDARYPGDKYQGRVAEMNEVHQFYTDDQFNNANPHDNFWELKTAVGKLTKPTEQLATIARSIQHHIDNHLEGSEGLEELLAMKLLFFEIYRPLVDNAAQRTSRPEPDATPAEINKERLVPRAKSPAPAASKATGTRAILNSLGELHEVTMSDGKTYGATILSEAKLAALFGVSNLADHLKGVFTAAGCANTDYQTKDGLIVNTNLYQQRAILKAIITLKPAAAEAIGFFNVRGSRKVYEVLNAANVHNQKQVWWFWTGEKWVKDQAETAYVGEGIIPLSHMDEIGSARFVSRNFDLDSWSGYLPGSRLASGGLVLGGLM